MAVAIEQFTAFRHNATVRARIVDVGVRDLLTSRCRGGDRVVTSGRGVKDDSRPRIVAIFATTGEFWTIGYPGRTFSLKDSKGLGYIHRLLEHQGVEFHALDLLRGPADVLPLEKQSSREDLANTTRLADVGDSGAMLDERAKREYR